MLANLDAVDPSSLANERIPLRPYCETSERAIRPIKGDGAIARSHEAACDDVAETIEAKLDGSAAPSNREASGRWRISGEICDGKRVASGMRPGAGPAHKACANLGISGGLPPALVTARPLAGRAHLLLFSRDGGKAPEAITDQPAIPAMLEGELSRIGDMPIFLVDWQTAQKLWPRSQAASSRMPSRVSVRAPFDRAAVAFHGSDLK